MSAEDDSTKESQPSRKIGMMDKLRADAGFPVTVISTIISFTLANTFTYGITGNPRAGILAGIISVPFCVITNILYTEQDYKIWKETESMRARGLPEILISKKPKYDWDHYGPLRKEIEQFYNYDAESKQNTD